MERMETHPELCFYHWQRQEEQAEAMKHAAQIVGPRARLNTARGINRVLGNLLKAQAQRKITGNAAAKMAYTCQLLLFSLPYLFQERALEVQQERNRLQAAELEAIAREFPGTLTPLENPPAPPPLNPGTLAAADRINARLQNACRNWERPAPEQTSPAPAPPTD
jgi:hypothetical protein